MAVQKTRTMFLDGEAYARNAVMAEYSLYQFVDVFDLPSDEDMAFTFANCELDYLEIEVPEGADRQFYCGIQYYLELIQGMVKHYRGMVNNPNRSIRVSF